MNTMNTFIGRIMRGLGVVGLVTALAIAMLPAHSAAAKTGGGGKISGGGAINIHVSNTYNGANLEGVKVTVYSSEGWEAASGLSDATGYFNAQVAIGGYKIVATFADYETAKTEATVQLGEVTKTALRMTPANGPLPPAQNDTKTELSLGTMILHAAEDNASGGVTGIAGAEVRIYSENDSQIVTKGVTDNKGDYSTDLGKGRYTVIVTAGGYETDKERFEIVTGDVVWVDALLKLNAGPLPVPTPMTAVPPGGATLTVHALNNPAGIAGVEGANVEMYDEENGSLAAQGLTDAKGKFSATVPGGTYTVSIVAAGYETFKVRVKAANDEETSVIAQMIATSGPAPQPTPANSRPAGAGPSTLDIFVTGDTTTDQGLADADVQIFSMTSGALVASGSTDKMGKFGADLPVDTYVVSITAAGYQDFQTTIRLPRLDNSPLIAALTSQPVPVPDPAPAPIPGPAPIPVPVPGCCSPFGPAPGL